MWSWYLGSGCGGRPHRGGADGGELLSSRGLVLSTKLAQREFLPWDVNIKFFRTKLFLQNKKVIEEKLRGTKLKGTKFWLSIETGPGIKRNDRNIQFPECKRWVGCLYICACLNHPLGSTLYDFIW